MLDKTLLRRFHQLIEVGLVERNKQFPIDLMHIDSQASARGAFHAGSRLRQMHQAHVRELEIRAIIAWQSLVRVHRTLGCSMSDALRKDLKGEINRVIEQMCIELDNSLQERLSKTSLTAPLSLDDACKNTVRKHEIEADLYVDSIETAQSREGKNSMAHHYNFYGNVGAVQTGGNAVANVLQNLGTEDRAAISAAVVQVRETLGLDSSLVPAQRHDLIEITDECVAELMSASPNNTKLLSMFNVLGTSIQSMASTQPAYQALKTALLPLGITLP